MFNKNKCLKDMHEFDNLDEVEKELNDLQMKMQVKRIKLQKECSHDLILSYGFGLADNKMSVCLICGTHLSLDKTLDVLSKKEVSKDSIIDVSDLINLDKESGKFSERILHLYLRAKEKLQSILNEDEKLSLEEIKIRIINDLIMYERDLKVKRLGKVKID